MHLDAQLLHLPADRVDEGLLRAVRPERHGLRCEPVGRRGDRPPQHARLAAQIEEDLRILEPHEVIRRHRRDHVLEQMDELDRVRDVVARPDALPVDRCVAQQSSMLLVDIHELERVRMRRQRFPDAAASRCRWAANTPGRRCARRRGSGFAARRSRAHAGTSPQRRAPSSPDQCSGRSSRSIDAPADRDQPTTRTRLSHPEKGESPGC
jgi:hypothetical protein